MSTTDKNIILLIEDLAELARSWRLRGFSGDEMCVALAQGTLHILESVGLDHEDVIRMVDRHFCPDAGRPAPTVRA